MSEWSNHRKLKWKLTLFKPLWLIANDQFYLNEAKQTREEKEKRMNPIIENLLVITIGDCFFFSLPLPPVTLASRFFPTRRRMHSFIIINVCSMCVVVWITGWLTQLICTPNPIVVYLSISTSKLIFALNCWLFLCLLFLSASVLCGSHRRKQ